MRMVWSALTQTGRLPPAARGAMAEINTLRERETDTHGNKGIVRIHSYAVTSRNDGMESGRTPPNNARGYMCGHRTFSNVVPPGRVERVVGAPARNIRTVRLTRAVFVLIRGPQLGLRVKLRERIDVTLPSASGFV